MKKSTLNSLGFLPASSFDPVLVSVDTTPVFRPHKSSLLEKFTFSKLIVIPILQINIIPSFIRHRSSSIGLFIILYLFATFFWSPTSFAKESLDIAETRLSTQPLPQSLSRSDASPRKLIQSKDQPTLQRLQLGVFSNRTEVDEITKKLRQHKFRTWIIPVEGGYAVGVGAFSSQANLDGAVNRLAAAGFADKIRVVEVEGDMEHSRIESPVVKAEKARSTLVGANVSRMKDGYVPKEKYEKLEQEVKLLKDQMQFLMKREAASGEDSKQTAAPATQAKAESIESDTSVASSEEPSDQPTGDDSQAEKDTSIVEGSREEEAEDMKRQLDTFLRRQKVLFKRGELEVEFGLTYAQDIAVSTCFNPDAESLFCPEGSRPAPRQITRAVDTSFSVSYGIIDDLALSMAIPYGYSELETDRTPFDVGVGGTQVDHTNTLEIGDISGALRYTVLHESGSTPSVAVNLNAKSTTGDATKMSGTGFWNVGAGLSLTKTVDPVVFFGSVGYKATLQEGAVDPGDQISYSFGGGFSLNDRISVSTAFSGSAILRTEVDGLETPGSAQDIASLQFSSTIKLTKALFVEPFVAFGLTKESGDYTVGIRIPYRFDQKYPLPFFSD
ncbi:MAG: SPOR domain-containing protein [Methylococcales bacterium]